MNVIGFNFTKIASNREQKLGKTSAQINIEFTNIEKESIEFLKDSESLKLSFNCGWTYNEQEKKNAEKKAELAFEGYILLSVEKSESKEILKSWKKKKVPQNIQIPLYNIILKKCTPKAVFLADEINLPPPTPLPKISMNKDAN